VVDKGWALKAVGGSTGSFHTIGHAWWTTGEHTNLWKEEVLLLKVVKEGIEVWPTKMGDGAKTSKQTATRQPLEVALTDVLYRK